MSTGQWRLSEIEKEIATELYVEGMSCGDIATAFNVSRQSMWDVLRRRTTMRPRNRTGSDNGFYRGGSVAVKAAHRLVEKAVETGALARPDQCEVCGAASTASDARSGIVAHHDDYTKPLAVRWLCRSCHFDWHSTNTPVVQKEDS